MSKLGWMAFQIVVIGAVVWIVADQNAHDGVPIKWGAAFAMGVILSASCTAAIIGICDAINRRRMASTSRPDSDAERLALGLPAIGRDDSETGLERRSLAGPGGRAGDHAKLVRSRRIS